MATRSAEVANAVPALAPERPVTWPTRTRRKLANGLEIVLAEAHAIPKFHGELFFAPEKPWFRTAPSALRK